MSDLNELVALPVNPYASTMKEMNLNTFNRRTFIGGAASLAISASSVRAYAANEKIDLAVVGAGGRGADNLSELRNTGVNVVALCDADSRRAVDSFKRYGDANRYSDWRKMFDTEKHLDAVLVATPDHNHAIVSIAAMKRGLHVYCEKPLAHSIWEVRQMAKVAAEKNVVTQMGTQGHAFDGTRRAVEVIRSGAIGDVRELHVWTDRPAGWWPQGVLRSKVSPPVPAELNWDVWLGPAPKRHYHSDYVPFKWRGRWDFGTGGIGDMGIHNLDTAFWGLELTAPDSVVVKDCSPSMTEPEMRESAPLWSIIELEFPKRGNRPPVKMTWYDGGKLPPQDLFFGEPILNPDGGSLIVGSKGTIYTRTWHGGETEADMFVILPRRQWADYQPPAPTIPRVKSHHFEWVDAIRGKGKTLSNFGYASILTESLLLGNVALRSGQRIEWDPTKMEAVGTPEAQAFVHPEFRKGWHI